MVYDNFPSSPSASQRLTPSARRRSSTDGGRRGSAAAGAAPPPPPEPLLLRIPLLLALTALSYLLGVQVAAPWMGRCAGVALLPLLGYTGYHAQPQAALPILLSFHPAVQPVALQVFGGFLLLLASVAGAVLLLEPFLPPMAVTLLALLCVALATLPLHWVVGPIACLLAWGTAMYVATTFRNRSRASQIWSMAFCLGVPALGVGLLQLARKEADVFSSADRMSAFLAWFLLVLAGHAFGVGVHWAVHGATRPWQLAATLATAALPLALVLSSPATAAFDGQRTVNMLAFVLDATHIALLLLTLQLAVQYDGALAPGLACIGSAAAGLAWAGYPPCLLRAPALALDFRRLLECLWVAPGGHCWAHNTALPAFAGLFVAAAYGLARPFWRQDLLQFAETAWSVEYKTFHMVAPDPSPLQRFPSDGDMRRLRNLGTDLRRQARLFEQPEQAPTPSHAVADDSPAKRFKRRSLDPWQELGANPAAKVLEFWDNVVVRNAEPPTPSGQLLHGCLRTWRVAVRRDLLLNDALRLLYDATPQELLCYNLRVTFLGEDGLDFGGLLREFFTAVATELLRPEHGLLEKTGDAVWLPWCGADKSADATAQEARYIAVGRFFGMAILQGQCLDLALPPLLYKLLLGQPITAQDTKELDPQYYRNRFELLLEEDGVQAMVDALGEPLRFVSFEHPDGLPIPLEPGGEEREVTEGNKLEYLEKLATLYLFHGSEPQLQAILLGFWDVIPLEVLRQLEVSASDLRLLLTGAPTIDVGDWQRSATIECKTRTEQEVAAWFFEILKEMSEEERGRLLAFSTGTSKVPSDGFKALNFKLQVDSDNSHLPTAHTCTATLHLPRCPDKAALRAKLLYVVREGVGVGFGLA